MTATSERARRTVRWLGILAVLIGWAAPLSAQTVTVSPRRVVFEGRDRTAEVTLLNRTDEPAVYRVSFVQARMSQDGRLEMVTDQRPDERPADGLVRFAPRQVTLAPGSPQMVRLFVRKPADLEEGEYRSHLVFRSVPKAAGIDIEEAAKVRDEGAVAPQLTMIPALVIPVIVRHGELDAEIAVDELVFHPAEEPETAPSVSLALRRSGERSVYGFAHFEFVSAADGRTFQVGVIRGLAVYVPNTTVRLRLPLDPPPDLDWRAGRLRVALTARPELDGGRQAEGTLLAEAEIDIP